MLLPQPEIVRPQHSAPHPAAHFHSPHAAPLSQFPVPDRGTVNCRADSLIPLPSLAPLRRNKWRCTSASMCISRPRYIEAMKVLRRVARNILVLGLPAEEQNPETWQLFLRRLCVEEPLFRNYEANWPVYSYYREWIQDSRRHPYPRHKDTGRKISGATRPTDSTQRAGSVQTVRYHSGTHFDRINGFPTPAGDENPSSPVAQTSTGLHPIHSCISSPPSSTALETSQTDSIDFCLLLQALVPRIDYLLPNFQRNGVNDPESLQVVASFPPPTLGIFLREDMALNSFQVRQVTLALQSLLGHT